ncbi:MAG: TetR/AcrR family transcriptional regulator [Eubacterium sp.]|nr:TetR/AcrR family transcriptional regulator [Eubacterium sp.]
MGKLDEKKKQKREALLSAAYDLFTSQGIFDTSISDIVKKAEMAKGTFYLYFKDKFDIRTALITEKAGKLFSVVREKMRDKKADSLEETVIQLVDIIIDELDADKRMLEFISKNLRWGIFHKVILEGGNEVSDSFYDWYNELIQSSGRTFRNHELMIYMIVELVNSTCYNVILYQEPVGLDELKEELALLIPVIIRNQEMDA